MTSLFSSKWLTCALALLVLCLAVIRTSHALKCHECSPSLPKCVESYCPDEELMRAFGFPAGADFDNTCVIVKQGDNIGKACNPNGKLVVALTGGKGKCKEVDSKDVKELQTETLIQLAAFKIAIDLFNNDYKDLKDAGLPIPPDMKKKRELMEEFLAKQPKELTGLGRSDSDGKGKMCACQTDLCNTDDLVNGASVLELWNGAVIVLAVVACLSLVNGF